MSVGGGNQANPTTDRSQVAKIGANNMAKYTITHACGHTTTQQIYGTNSHGERDRKVAWWQTVDCPQCYGRKQAESRANAAHVKADKVNEWMRAGIFVGAIWSPAGSTGASAKVVRIDVDNDIITCESIDGAIIKSVGAPAALAALKSGKITVTKEA